MVKTVYTGEDSLNGHIRAEETDMRVKHMAGRAASVLLALSLLLLLSAPALAEGTEDGEELRTLR